MPGLTQASPKRLEGRNPLVAALASVVFSLPLSETTPIPGIELANAKVKAWRRAARKAKGEDSALGPLFGATWGDKTFQVRYGELDASASAHSSEWEPDGISRESTPP